MELIEGVFSKKCEFPAQVPKMAQFFDNFYPMCKIVGIVLTHCEGKFFCLTNAASCTYPYVSRIFLISYFFVNKHVNFSLPQNALKNMNFADKKFQFLNKLQYCFVNEHVNFSSPQNTLRNMSFANQKVPVFFGSTFFEAILSSLYTPPPS